MSPNGIADQRIKDHKIQGISVNWPDT